MTLQTKSQRTLPIERASDLDSATFHERFLSGTGKPVVVTDGLRSWGAMGKWDFDFFKSRYGDDSVTPMVYPEIKYLKLMKLRDYIDGLDKPVAASRGIWIDAKTRFPCDPPNVELASSLYLSWNVFRDHPELLDDVNLSPEFVEDWLPLLPEALRAALENTNKFFAAGLLVGPAHACMGLHCDVADTHAYVAQIVGRKKCILFSPEDVGCLYDGTVDVEAPDFVKYPLLSRATAHICTLNPGEILFIPQNWWHHISALEKSIGVNYNFFNRLNIGGYMTGLLQNLPAVVAALEATSGAKEALGLNWKSRGFD
jgi:Cupin-like domain